MPIRFQPIQAATCDGVNSEPGQLVWVSDMLVALLLRAEGGWFVEHGLGPFERQDIMFETIASAENWIRSSLGELHLSCGK